MTTIGPIFYLRWFGMLLPCLEKDEDKKARQALQAINQAGTIAWYHKSSDDSSAAQNIGSNVVNFFKSAISRQNSGSSHGNDRGEPESVPAHFMVRDSPESERPEIFVDPQMVAVGRKKKQPALGYKLNFHLSRVGQVDVNPNTGIIRIMAKKPTTNTNDDDDPGVKCLLTLQLIKGNDTSVVSSADDRDSFVHNLLVLMEWERQRRIAADEHDTIAEQEAAEGGNFLTQRAKKTAHFAKRELELQTTKRNRENRKAKLVNETGGLKYTALAMIKNAENA